jgi:hypothetical protein
VVVEVEAGLAQEETCLVPCAACCTLREISCVAAPCSSIRPIP